MPPSATAKFTAAVAVWFSRAPSSVAATPSAQYAVPPFVSHVPGPVLCRVNPVTVRPPPALNVAVSVPSSAPSAASAMLPCPTRSRTWPL